MLQTPPVNSENCAYLVNYIQNGAYLIKGHADGINEAHLHLRKLVFLFSVHHSLKIEWQ